MGLQVTEKVINQTPNSSLYKLIAIAIDLECHCDIECPVSPPESCEAHTDQSKLDQLIACTGYSVDTYCMSFTVFRLVQKIDFTGTEAFPKW